MKILVVNAYPNNAKGNEMFEKFRNLLEKASSYN